MGKDGGQPRFAGPQGALDVAPLQLRGHPLAEDAEHRHVSGPFGHGYVVHHREVAHHPATGVEQRDGEIALHRQRLEAFALGGEMVGHLLGVVTHLSAQHLLAGRALQVVLDVAEEAVPGPQGQGAYTLTGGSEFGDETITYAEGVGGMLHQRLHEVFAGGPRRARDDGLQQGINSFAVCRMGLPGLVSTVHPRPLRGRPMPCLQVLMVKPRHDDRRSTGADHTPVPTPYQTSPVTNIELAF